MLRNLRRHSAIPKEIIDNIIRERENMNNSNSIEELMELRGGGVRSIMKLLIIF